MTGSSRTNSAAGWRARRWPRRRVLQTGAIGAAALPLGLAACGDDEEEAPSPTPAGQTPAAGATPTPTEAPRRGGVWRIAMAGDPSALDPMQGTALPTHQLAGFVYSGLFRYKAGPGVDPTTYEVEPDAAEGFETPDGIEYIVKLKPNVRFHPPVDRLMDAEDVVFSWRRLIGEIPGFAGAPYAATPKAYIDRIEAVDARTVRFRLKAPRGDLFSYENKWYWVMPKETGTAFDPTKQLVGSGPWIFESYTPGSVIKLRRNDRWHFGPDVPYMDAVEIYIIPEYATRFQQFLAGRLDYVDVFASDIERLRSGNPSAKLLRALAELPVTIIAFSTVQNPSEPWSDPRVRKALSMSLDRDAMLDAAYDFRNLERFGIEGLKRVWNNEIPAQDRAYWLDPKGEFRFAEADPQITAANKQAFAYDPAEAKKLLEAAGLPNGFEADLFTTTARYGQAFNTVTELIQQYAAQVGIDLTIRDVDYSSVYITQIVVQKNFRGLLHIPKRTGILANLRGYFVPGEIANYGKIQDQTLIDGVAAIERTLDREEARRKVLEFQNFANERMYIIPLPVGALGAFVAVQGNVRNADVYQVPGQGWGTEVVPYLWKAS